MSILQTLPTIQKPVRKIVPGNRGVTGVVPILGKYESTLERDLMEILRFDPEVERFTPQPLTIEYLDQTGRTRTYTPDGLIQFKTSSVACQPPILFEVKYRADFRKDWRNLIPKFRAAKSYSAMHGWRFQVFTEREIRTPYLNNVKFLWQFLQRAPDPAMKVHVLELLNDLDEADPELLLCALCSDATNRARFIPVIWHLIAIGAIDCDLNHPLTMRSLIRTQGGS
jgi:hypothetical protein